VFDFSDKLRKFDKFKYGNNLFFINMADYSGKIIGIVIALLLAGTLLPIGLDSLANFTSSDSTIQSLVTSVLPIMAVVGIVLLFIAGKSKNK